MFFAYFLSQFKDLKINKIYDDNKNGKIQNITICNTKDEKISNSENFLIFNPSCYNLLKKKLLNINAHVNIIDITFYI
jgi:Tfp pilus assembly protein FimT